MTVPVKRLGPLRTHDWHLSSYKTLSPSSPVRVDVCFDLNDKKLPLSSIMKLTEDFGCDIAGLSSTELNSVISLKIMLSS